MANWKLWVLFGALLGALSCGEDEKPGEGNGGGLDGGGDDGGKLDGGPAPGDGGGVYVPPGDGGPLADGGEACNDRTLKIKIRDFKEDHPDFEDFTRDVATPGIVEFMLGSDSKPVFKAANSQVSSAASFAEWYRDVPGVNQTIEVERTLETVQGGAFQYADSDFFPIDGRGWGNEGNDDGQGVSHNYHFTTEIHTRFTYQPGQVFTFKGDDDLWIFVNGRLALDLGGLHSELTGTIDFTAKAAELGIQPGQTYPMDIFHAERHTVHSRFTITTNIECFENVVVI